MVNESNEGLVLLSNKIYYFGCGVKDYVVVVNNVMENIFINNVY